MVGKSAYLPCRVKRLGGKSVSRPHSVPFQYFLTIAEISEKQYYLFINLKSVIPKWPLSTFDKKELVSLYLLKHYLRHNPESKFWFFGQWQSYSNQELYFYQLFFQNSLQIDFKNSLKFNQFSLPNPLSEKKRRSVEIQLKKNDIPPPLT